MTAPDGRRVACIGAGNVGRAWALVFARAGFRVALYDLDSAAIERAGGLLARNARDLEAAGLIASAESVMTLITAQPVLEEALAGVEHVQESVREDLAIKREVFETLGRLAPVDATLASSTSALPGSEFMEQAPGRERCLVAHPVNPPSLIPLVELCPTPWTDEGTLQRARTLMQEVGQHPIVLRREVPGFILNRLQYTLVGEALHLVGEGYCDAEDIDAVITQGLALRWVLMGPFQVAHLNASEGFQGFVDQLGDMMRTVGREARPDYPWDDALIARIHDQLANSTPVEAIADRQLQRDRNIMSLLNWRNGLGDAANDH
jgi:L-gulonate 3-dehydrogenase